MSVMDWLTYGASALLFGIILATFEAIIVIVKRIKEERNNGR
jgi:hypothetical protein